MSSNDLTEWSRQRWCRVIGSIVAVQFLAVVVLSSRQPLNPRPVVRDTNWRMPLGTKDHTYLEGSLPNNPWLFASANPAGFSGSAWFRPASTDYQVPAWEDPSDFLDLKETIPSNPLAQFSGIETLPRESNLELASQFFVLKGSTPRGNTKASTWSFSGDIATNTLKSAVTIPNQMGLDIVSNTVVQIAILPSGLIHVARVWRSSGSHSIDLQAVAIAQTLSFVPSRATREQGENPILTWGWFEVQWHTEALPVSDATKSSNP